MQARFLKHFIFMPLFGEKRATAQCNNEATNETKNYVLIRLTWGIIWPSTGGICIHIWHENVQTDYEQGMGEMADEKPWCNKIMASTKKFICKTEKLPSFFPYAHISTTQFVFPFVAVSVSYCVVANNIVFEYVHKITPQKHTFSICNA